MKQNLKINDVEKRQSKAGKEYWAINTNDGTMTCFEKNIAEELSAKIGSNVACEVAESKGFKNIRGISVYKEEVVRDEIINEPKKENNKDKFSVARDEKNKSFWISYSKDTFNGMIGAELHVNVERNEKYYLDKMDLAIKLTKIAIKEFS